MADAYSDGLKAYRAGDYDTASDLFHAATDADDDNAKAWNAYGLTLSKLKDYDNADTCYENALMIDPGNETYQKNREINERKRTGGIKKIQKPLSSINPSRPWWQWVGGFVGMVFIFLILAFAGAGGNHKETVQRVDTVTPSSVATEATPVITIQVTTNPTTIPSTVIPTTEMTSETTIPTTAPVVEEPLKITLAEKNAASKALNYLQYMSFSRDGLVHQLEYNKFTHAEAEYGADNTGADWNEQAAKKAKTYLETMPFSRDELIKQLEYNKFTSSQAEYGAKSVGY